jgi:multiple antibiotic resistance protein
VTNFAAMSAVTFGVQAFITLLVIIDPPGATPIFLTLVSGSGKKRQRELAWQAAAVSFGVVILFAIFGNLILDYLHISVDALQAAGGLLMLLISLQLLVGGEDSTAEKQKDVNVAMVPLGTPLLAGPGAIVTTIIYAQHAQSNHYRFFLLLAIIAVHLVIGLTLMFSTKIFGLIKESGVTLFARIAGLLLAAIAVQMIATAIKGLFNLA